ncbi:hypothetical protein [Leifsonia sp. NPDC058230]|uniref:hypothetical protein n=1 Tax=Leifsonia sp. NPDC058230 TaxID=3346391 RepID=UPI0036DA22F9
MGTSMMKYAWALGAAAALSTLLAACGTSDISRSVFEPTAEDTTVVTNALEAKNEVLSLYRAMQELLGGDWIDRMRDWGPCSLSDGREGVSYAFYSRRIGQSLPADPGTVAEEAQAIWARFGYSVEIEHDDVVAPPRLILSDPPLLAGTKRNGLLVQFSVGQNYADFSARSRCVLGDAEKLNRLEE